MSHPLIYQTAYQKNISSGEAVFMTQEAIRTLLQRDGHCILTMYDIEKAFDSVELPVLLGSLFDAGINGKGWCLMWSWYTDCISYVKIPSQNPSRLAEASGRVQFCHRCYSLL